MIFVFSGPSATSRKFVDTSTGHRPLEQIGSEDLSGEETSSSEQSSAARRHFAPTDSGSKELSI